MRTRSSGRFRKNSLAAAAATTAMGAASASAAIIHVDPVDITLGPTFGSHTIDFTGTVPLSQTLNIFGGIMRCDVIAEGVVAAAREVSLTVPLIVRLAGTNVELGKKILEESGLPIIAADDLGDAAEKAVKAVKEAA